MIKGNLCQRRNLEKEDFQNENDGFSEKHKLIIIMTLSMLLLSLIYFFISAQKQKRKYKILKYPRNTVKGS